MKPQKQPITGLLLAGGKSSRMGQNKAFLMFKNKPFIKHIADAVLPITESIIIVSDDIAYDDLGFQRVNDIIKDAGPLSGIVSGLKAIKTPRALVVSCDVPLLNTEVLNLLIAQIEENTDQIIQLKTKTHTMPLLAIYPKSCLEILEKSLLSGNRKVKIAIENCMVKTVVVPSLLEKYVQNINTPKQYINLNESTR